MKATANTPWHSKSDGSGQLSVSVPVSVETILRAWLAFRLPPWLKDRNAKDRRLQRSSERF